MRRLTSTSAPSQWQPQRRPSHHQQQQQQQHESISSRTSSHSNIRTPTESVTMQRSAVAATSSSSSVVAAAATSTSNSNSHSSAVDNPLNIWKPRAHIDRPVGDTSHTTAANSSSVAAENGANRTAATTLSSSTPQSRSATDMLRESAMRRVAANSTLSTAPPARRSHDAIDDDHHDDGEEDQPIILPSQHRLASGSSGVGRVFPTFQSSRTQQANHTLSTSAATSNSSPTRITAPTQQQQQQQEVTPHADEKANKDGGDDEDDGVEKCAICTYSLTDLAVLPCAHYYCLSCISEWFQISTTCPLCKAPASQLEHFIPPLTPHRMKLEEQTPTPAAAAASSSSFDSPNPLASFVSRCISHFHAHNPGLSLERQILPIEKMDTKHRLGMDDQEMEDYELAARLEQQYNDFQIQAEGSSEEEMDVVCVYCNLPDDPEILLLCDCCNLGYHTRCLDPPLTHIPEGDWFCTGCLDDVEREVRAQMSEERARRAEGLDPCPFAGGPSTPQRGRSRLNESGNSEGRARIRIHMRRTIEKEERDRKRSMDGWKAQPVSATSAKSNTGTHNNWGLASTHHPASSPPTSSSPARKVSTYESLYGPNAQAHYQPDNRQHAPHSGEEIEYDEYGYERATSASATTAAASSSFSSTSSSKRNVRRRVEYKEDSEEDEPEQYIPRPTHTRHKPSVKQESTIPQSTARAGRSTRFDYDGDGDDAILVEQKQMRTSTKKRSISAKPKSKLKPKPRTRRRSSSSDDMSDFITDDIIEATPSSDEDGTKAAFLPTQRDNKASRRAKLARKKQLDQTTKEAARKHRQKIMAGDRTSSSSASSSDSSSSESDESDYQEEEEQKAPSRKKQRRETRSTALKSVSPTKPSASRSKAHTFTPPPPPPPPPQIPRQFVHGPHATDSEDQDDVDEEEDDENADGGDFEDISSFEATQERADKQKLARHTQSSSLAPTSSLARLSSPFEAERTYSNGVSTHVPIQRSSSNELSSKKLATSSSSMRGHGGSGSHSKSSAYRLPLASITSSTKSHDNSNNQRKRKRIGEEEEEDEAVRPSSESESEDEAELASSQPRRSKQSFGSRRTSKFFHGAPSVTSSVFTPTSTHNRRSDLNSSVIIPETPDHLNTSPSMPTSSPNSPLQHPSSVAASRTIRTSPFFIPPTPSMPAINKKRSALGEAPSAKQQRRSSAALK